MRTSRKTTRPAQRRRTTPPTAEAADQVPEVAERDRRDGRRLTPRQRAAVPTQACLVQAACGCVGMLMPAASRLDGEWPVSAVRITTGCPAGHPSRVAAGVIERFVPTTIRVVEPAGA